MINTNGLFMVMVVVCLAGCCANDEHAQSSRGIVIDAKDLGSIQQRTIAVSSDAGVDISYCEYNGHQEGFWGSETSPPFNVLTSLALTLEGHNISIPEGDINDLANVSASPMAVYIDRERNDHILTIEGGDGIHSYESKFRFQQSGEALIYIGRSVNYMGP